MGKKMNFENKESYGKWLAYGHIHGVFHKHNKPSKYPEISIHGKHHKVKHNG